MKKRLRDLYKKCVLCNSWITEKEDSLHSELSRDVIFELNPKINLARDYGTYKGYLHRSCYEALDVPTQRRLTLRDWTYRLIGEVGAIWCPLSPSGECLYDEMFSDIPKVDERLQKLKPILKTEGIEGLSPEDQKWLKRQLN